MPLSVIWIQWVYFNNIYRWLSAVSPVLMHWRYCSHFEEWKHFTRYWPFVREIHWSLVNSPHKGQWRGALMFTLMLANTKCLTNSWIDSDLRCYGTKLWASSHLNALWSYPNAVTWLLKTYLKSLITQEALWECIPLPFLVRGVLNSLANVTLQGMMWFGNVWCIK